MTTDAGPWSRPALLAQVLRPRRDGYAEAALHVAALDPYRALRLEETLAALHGVIGVAIDTAARRVRVVFDPARAALADLLRACGAAGCAAQPLHRDALDDHGRAALAASLKRVLVAGLFAMQAMMFAFVLYVGAVDPLDPTTVRLFRWLGLLAAVPVVGYAAWPFYRDALAGMRARRAGIDVPVALAIVLIFAASVANALRAGGEIYFDSISMFVFVLLLGRHLELRAEARHRALGDAVATALPLVAQRLGADGRLETVAAIELAHGDRVHVPEGAAAPCDGVLAGADARVDASRWTGESRAQARRVGDAIAAGCSALGGPLELRVERAVADGAAAVLARAAASARRGQDLADGAQRRSARRFVWRVLALALAAAAFWLWRDPSRAFDATVAVLVVACPCAFGLAAPAVLTRALALLARRGVLVTRAAALRALARVDVALFDKTGTLTEPDVDTGAITTFRGVSRSDALRWAVALARASSHPVAAAAVRMGATGEIPHPVDVGVVAGHGIAGVIAGRRMRLGHAAFAGAAEAGDDALWLADDVGPLAKLPLAERVRAEAAACVAALRASGVECVLASGDAPARVEAAARRVGIETWWARQTPADKLARVRAAQAAGRVVLAVGDGGNDAPALAAADVSATPGDAVDLARARADLLLTGGLEALPQARALAAHALRILAQNRRWALGWNLGVVPFAAAGLVPPWLAALGMAASSLAVVLNSLRVRERTAAKPAIAPPLRARTA